MERPLTATEKARIRADKAKQAREAEFIANSLKWRDLEPADETFVLDEIPPEKQWTKLKWQRIAPVTTHAIYRTFFSDSIIDKLGGGADRLDFISGARYTKLKNGKRSKTMHMMHVKKSHILQATAVYILLVGRQNSPARVRKNNNFIKQAIEEARKFLQLKSGIKAYSVEILLKVISKILMTKLYADDVSKHFRSIVEKLGQAVAGDEKLFFFSGNSGNVRLVVSKPDRIGLWFYELCCRLKVGDKELSFLLDFLMHDSLEERISVKGVVERWVTCMWDIGSDLVEKGSHPNPQTYLAADSYYECADARDFFAGKEAEIYNVLFKR